MLKIFDWGYPDGGGNPAYYLVKESPLGVVWRRIYDVDCSYRYPAATITHTLQSPSGIWVHHNPDGSGYGGEVLDEAPEEVLKFHGVKTTPELQNCHLVWWRDAKKGEWYYYQNPDRDKNTVSIYGLGEVWYHAAALDGGKIIWSDELGGTADAKYKFLDRIRELTSNHSFLGEGCLGDIAGRNRLVEIGFDWQSCWNNF